jgi:YggT family protein
MAGDGGAERNRTAGLLIANGEADGQKVQRTFCRPNAEVGQGPMQAGARIFESCGMAGNRFGHPGMAGDGGAERNRTAGLLIANEALSQLSYSPEPIRRSKARQGEGFRKAGEARQGAGKIQAFPGKPGLRAKGGGRYNSRMNPIFFLLIELLEIYKWIVIAAVIVSWLIVFNVINTYNSFVRSLLHMLSALTEPVFRRVRKFLPPMGGLDLSPIVVFVIIITLQYTIGWISTRYGI